MLLHVSWSVYLYTHTHIHKSMCMSVSMFGDVCVHLGIYLCMCIYLYMGSHRVCFWTMQASSLACIHLDAVHSTTLHQHWYCASLGEAPNLLSTPRGPPNWKSRGRPKADLEIFSWGPLGVLGQIRGAAQAPRRGERKNHENFDFDAFPKAPIGADKTICFWVNSASLLVEVFSKLAFSKNLLGFGSKIDVSCSILLAPLRQL